MIYNNDTILNEVYFGRTNRTKTIEYILLKMMRYYEDLIIETDKNLSDADKIKQKATVSSYDSLIDAEYKKNADRYITHSRAKENSKSGRIITFWEQTIIKQILKWNKSGKYKLDPNQYNDPKLEQLVIQLEDTLQSVFGFDRVRIFIIESKGHKNAMCIDMAEHLTGFMTRNGYAKPYYKRNRQKYKDAIEESFIGNLFNKTKQYLSDKFEFIFGKRSDYGMTDNTGRTVTMDERRDALIVDNSGIRLNTDKYPCSAYFIIYNGLLKPTPVELSLGIQIMPNEVMACLLHEIGHVFSKYIIPRDALSNRYDEKFADRFASLFGYGQETITLHTKFGIFYEAISDRGSKYFTNTDKALARQDMVEFLNAEKEFINDIRKNIDRRHDNALNIHILNKTIRLSFLKQPMDPHPAYRYRVHSQLSQMKYERDHANLTNRQRSQLSNDIKNTKEVMKRLHKGELFRSPVANLISKELINYKSPMTGEREEEAKHREYSGDSGYIHREFENLYNKTKQNRRR